MAISDDYTIREFRQMLLDGPEKERLNLFLRVAGQCYPDPESRVTILEDLLFLMDHPGKDFIWHRVMGEPSVFICQSLESIQRLALTHSNGLWFEFWYDKQNGHWEMAEVNRRYAQRVVNPDQIEVLPPSTEQDDQED